MFETNPCPTVKIKAPHVEGGHIVINESDFDAAVHERFIDPPPAPIPPPPPLLPPVPADPLDGLPKNWREKKAVELRKFAQAVSGRVHDNVEQAIATIEAALAARAGK